MPAPALLLAPAAVALLLGLAMEWVLLPNPVFFLRVQTGLGPVVILLGLLVSLVALCTYWLRRSRQAAIERAVAAVTLRGDEAHRRFVRRLSHELKNPLMAMRAGLANLGDDGELGSGAASLVNIRRQVERLSRLTNDLRKLAELDLGEVEWAPVDLAAIVAEAVEMAEGRGRGGASIAVSVQQVPWPLSPVQGDRDLLLLAIYNLLDNALKFSGDGSGIEIRATEDGTRATVAVADTGRGIAADDLSHVVEELYRGRSAEAVEGSGLGLALVDRVARLHGGALAIRSREGKGTVAMLHLPLADRVMGHVSNLLPGRDTGETSAG